LMHERSERIRAKARIATKWKNPPVRIEKWECIACDSCVRECPPQFGAIFNHGVDVEVVPELCSGCNRCIAVCPMDCIYPDPDWRPTAVSNPALWAIPGSGADPYLHVPTFDLCELGGDSSVEEAAS
jgi:Na+-translocating ferredoxin:NAD+ oxidoreductase subunit B